MDVQGGSKVSQSPQPLHWFVIFKIRSMSCHRAKLKGNLRKYFFCISYSRLHTITSPEFIRGLVFINLHLLFYNSTTTASLNLIFCSLIFADYMHTIMNSLYFYITCREHNAAIKLRKSAKPSSAIAKLPVFLQFFCAMQNQLYRIYSSKFQN
jgi:hypothetical protein